MDDRLSMNVSQNKKMWLRYRTGLEEVKFVPKPIRTPKLNRAKQHYRFIPSGQRSFFAFFLGVKQKFLAIYFSSDVPLGFGRSAE